MSRAHDEVNSRSADWKDWIRMMTGEPPLLLKLVPAMDNDVAELEMLTYALRTELLTLDVETVDLVTSGELPERAKGIGSVAGWLAVGLKSYRVLRTVVRVLRNWVAHTDRTVEVHIGSDRLKLTGVTSEQQDKLIDAWVARYEPGA